MKVVPENNGQRHPEESRGPSLFNLISILFLITFLLNVVFSSFSVNRPIQISYSQFTKLVEKGHVGVVEVSDLELYILPKRGTDQGEIAEILGENYLEGQNRRQLQNQQPFYTGRIDDPGLVALLQEYEVEFSQPIVRVSPILSFMTRWIFPVVMMYLIYFLFFRRMIRKFSAEGGLLGGMGNVGKSKAKMYTAEDGIQVTFADVAGQDEAKESLTELVDYLRHPEKYQTIGAKQPKGALLVGPPGTGKTLLAKAMAGEAKIPFYSLSGSEFVEMFVGVGASRVRDLFQEAKNNAPAIIFIDEIDAIGKARDNQFGGNDEREQTLNQLLAEMDGFTSGQSVLVLAATNRPEVLDRALLRPGRFDRRVIVDKPDLPGREAILKVHTKNVKIGTNVDLSEIALMTSGAAGADLANMVNEAALRAVRLKREEILQEDLHEAVEVVIAGKEKKDRVLNSVEREMVAYHEVGHALVSALQRQSTPVQKITIVPRTMGSLGYTMNVPEEERYLLTKDELLAQITTLLGGRAAELVQFGVVTTGAANDIERATRLAKSMVTQYGMGDTFGPMGLESTENQYLDGRNVAIASDRSLAEADQEVKAILATCQERAIELLQENKAALTRISLHLLETENITGSEFMDLLAN